MAKKNKKSEPFKAFVDMLGIIGIAFILYTFSKDYCNNYKQT